MFRISLAMLIAVFGSFAAAGERAPRLPRPDAESSPPALAPSLDAAAVADPADNAIRIQVVILEVDNLSRERWHQVLEKTECRPFAAGQGAMLPTDKSEAGFLRQLSEAGGVVRALSRPHVMALNGQEAMIQVGMVQQIVSDWTVPTDANAATPVVATFDPGIILSLTPRITANGRISIALAVQRSFASDADPQLSVKDESEVFRSSSLSLVATKTRIDTPAGRTLVLSGLCSGPESRGDDSDRVAGAPTGLMLIVTPMVVSDDE